MNITFIQAYGDYTEGQTAEVDDAVAQALVAGGIAKPAEDDASNDNAAETAAVEKAFLAKNEKALEAKAISIRNDMETKLKSLQAHVAKQEEEIAKLKLKAPTPDIGVATAKPDGRFGFKDLGDYGISFVRSQLGQADHLARQEQYRLAVKSRLGKKAATLNTANDTGLVPYDFQRTIFQPEFGNTFAYKDTTLWVTESEATYVPVVRDLDHTSSIGGVTVTSLTDSTGGTSMSGSGESKVGIDSQLVALKLIGAYCPISEQMLRWSPYNVSQLTGQWMKNALEFEIENQFTSDASNGWATSTSTNPTLYQIPRTTANKIQYVDVLNLLAAAYNPANPNYDGFSFRCTAATRTELLKMKFPDNTGSQPVWLPSGQNVNNAAFRPQLTLLGIPVVCTEFGATLGGEHDLALIHPASYFMVRHANSDNDFVAEESIHIRWDKGGKVIRMFAELGFKCAFAGKTKNKAGEYFSPFVVLDDVVAS